MPTSFETQPRRPDYLTTAHDRYKESLLETVPVERRVANAIMGIEALLSNDNAELAFRLSYRAAKLLGVVGYSALTVKRYFAKAYWIRSVYAHGGFITEKERQKIERDFAKVDTFAFTIIDYLRALFIICTQIPDDKTGLLSLIDDGFIDKSASSELGKKLSKAKKTFFGKP
jgi:hypothetical protein